MYISNPTIIILPHLYYYCVDDDYDNYDATRCDRVLHVLDVRLRAAVHQLLERRLQQPYQPQQCESKSTAATVVIAIAVVMRIQYLFCCVNRFIVFNVSNIMYVHSILYSMYAGIHVYMYLHV